VKRYKRKFDIYYHQLGRFNETVVHVSKYLDILKDELKALKRELIVYKGDSLQLFNEKFYGYKIQFALYDQYSGTKGLIKGETNRDNIVIKVNEDFYFYTSKENLNVFNLFTEQLLLLLSHELVHRGQYYIRAGDKLNFYNFDGDLDGQINIEYLKNPQEVMAYALMYIESLRYSGFTNNDIMEMLRSGNFVKSQSLHIDFYINKMREHNRDAFLKFRKYILQYINDPVRYDLKVM
jgi:hypothetical protein